MNRRGFLSFLGMGAAAVAADPERLLWTPGSKLISIPPLVAYRSSAGNTFIHPEVIAAEWLRVLRINMAILTERIEFSL